MEKMSEPPDSEQVKAMKDLVNAMLTSWYMQLPREAKDALLPASLDQLRDGFIAICMLGLEDR